MELEAALASLPVDRWLTRQAIVFDWFDGPREGLCAMAEPECEFFFELLDERLTAEDLDDRLFRLRELPPGSVANVLTALRDLGGPTGPVWVPVMRFASGKVRQTAEQQVERTLAQRRPTSIVLHTRDLMHFLGWWRIER